MSITPLSLPQPPAKVPEFGRDALIVYESLVRIYQSGSVEVRALQGLDLVVDSGEMVAVVGASGSGKSALSSILAGVDAPTAGRVRVDRWNLLDARSTPPPRPSCTRPRLPPRRARRRRPPCAAAVSSHDPRS